MLKSSYIFILFNMLSYFYLLVFLTSSFSVEIPNKSFVQLSEHQMKEARKALQDPNLFGGDMVGITESFVSDRNGIVPTSYRWPNATIPYVLSSSVKHFESLIEVAMQHYHETTCVRFVPRKGEKDYVRIHNGGNCYSNIGRSGGKQYLSLGRACEFVGIIIHELGHAVGFYHEHQRSDRDKYVKIFYENIKPGDESEFARLHSHENILYNDFDYNSIMIYGNTAFSKDDISETMRPLRPLNNSYTITDPFLKYKMSDSDIYRVNKMYKCKQ